MRTLVRNIMFRNSILSLFSAVGLTLLITACQTPPGFNIFGSGQETDENRPISNFVDARQTIQVEAGKPLGIASYHRGYSKLTALEISINGQPTRPTPAAERSNPLPDYLATTRTLVRSQPVDANLQQVTFPSAACQYLLTVGGPIPPQTVTLTPASSVWTVCLIWTGHTPGTYDLTLVAVDDAQHKSDPIHQRIEVR